MVGRRVVQYFPLKRRVFPALSRSLKLFIFTLWQQKTNGRVRTADKWYQQRERLCIVDWNTLQASCIHVYAPCIHRKHRAYTESVLFLTIRSHSSTSIFLITSTKWVTGVISIVKGYPRMENINLQSRAKERAWRYTATENQWQLNEFGDVRNLTNFVFQCRWCYMKEI